ncbi:uncharacterized protein LTR77_003008 [Saxophila tyrrhenica]|uniref:Uncharacterized protein n=1 Tax=Saxophila tyrrhenica TaxID=1690608 RepID=A0AAV9PGQ8_9PEZI|nr:hypothetical protein LTR77_003008 [Saxophila tyrrhenica]
MPFADNVSSVSGRNSRASNVSGITGASRSIRSHPMPQTDALSSAGILSMLKTSTDSGDIGALSFNTGRLPTMPRPSHQRRGHHPRHSGSANHHGMSSHHHYAPSQTSRVSSSREWDLASGQQRRGSFTSMQSMPPSIPPAHLGKSALQMPPTLDDIRDSRSYSMTSAPPTQPLPRHRSATSLKSQGHEPRHAHGRAGYPPQVMPENRPPYVYPTRLKRPGYRSPSPALSDTVVPGPPPAAQMGRRQRPARPPPQTFNSEYGPDYNSDPRYLNVRPPPRAMPNLPANGFGPPQPQYPYQNQAAMRSAPGLTMPMNNGWPHHQHPQQPPLPGHPQQMPHRPPHPGAPYPPRPGYAAYGHPQYPVHRGPTPPAGPNMVSMAHHMFHNAARMARHLPSRTDTPLTGPPSSDPPSSGTAPSSSSPPTPRDQDSLQVAVDPAFIDPALADLPDSSSQPMLAHQYLRYTEGLEKEADDQDVEAVHPSVPPTGFVQRVRAMLESKAAADAAIMKEAEREKSSSQHGVHATEVVLDADDLALYAEVEEIHELAANETPRFTVIEEFEAPVELPGSPIRLAELSASPIQSKRRLTRDLVKAGLAGSSVDNTENSEDDVTGRASIDMLVSHKPSKSHDVTIEVNAAQRSVLDEDDLPSTPAAASNNKHADQAKAASEAGSSPALGFSAAGHALGFDNTTTSEDTRTEDPFALDADTITLQHQQSKERMEKTTPHHAEANRESQRSDTETNNPVSPILAGQEVSRYSAVSPLHTQTLGIDETLRLASESGQDETSTNEQTTSSTGFDDSQPPPTPKTPKTYSKSVQLQPATTMTDTPSSNRLSLPPDLSTVGDKTMNSNSEMVTDVAVRFSLPQTTITVHKPQIIEIPPSSSPVRELTEPKPSERALQPKAKHNSVAFADEVAPLKINKRPEQHHPNQKSIDGKVNKTKSIIRRPSPMQETAESAHTNRSSTTDLRFSGINGVNKRFGSTHLPGLKEESVEEMSISDKRVSDLTGGFQFPLPARIAAVKAMQERRMQESAEKAKARRALRHPGRPLAEIRDLPSLNFSRMDLIDKLNEALEIRPSKSSEVVRRREVSTIYCPSPQRPQSTEPLRERYTSFFSKPEDFSSFFVDPDTDDEPEVDDEIDVAAEEGIPAVEVQPSTEVDLAESNSRPLSPEDFISVASQVNRLSIPSVSALSDRLSEILPNLRELQLDSILANFEGEGAGSNPLGLRPETVLSNRTSAGFRTLAERAEEIVKNGTHDSTVPMTKLLGNNKDLPPLPGSVSVDKISAVLATDGKQSPYLSGSISAPTQLGKDIPRPASALVRDKPPMTEDEVRTLLPPEGNPIIRNGKRAMVMSTASTRPWNQDENYPWNGTKIDMDLTVPSQAHTRNSIAAEVQRERGTKSLELTSTGEPTNTTRGIDIGSIFEHNPTTTLTEEQLTGVSITQHFRKQSKRSIIGSITKKMGLGSHSDGNTTRTITSPTRAEFARSRSSQAHRPGERYPTSSLTPPAVFNLDEVRSFFSDDSSDKDQNASFRKRLTKLNKSKGKTVRIDSGRHSIDVANTAYDPGEIVTERIGASSSANTYDGVGMGKTEFRIKRFGEKLRHLMAKGGELVRSWSQRSKPRAERVREDWLSDSLYSGV